MKVALPAAALVSILILAGCAESGQECSGFTISSSTGNSFTVPDLMSHATAMGMSQQEAETLIYLEGIDTSTTVERGKSLCTDGKPG